MKCPKCDKEIEKKTYNYGKYSNFVERVKADPIEQRAYSNLGFKGEARKYIIHKCEVKSI